MLRSPRDSSVTATPQGSALAQETRARRYAWFNARLRELSPADQAVLARAAELMEQIAGS